MASNIDPTKPQTGIDQPVKVIRDNFAAAKSEIEYLQSLVGSYEQPVLGSSVSGIPILPIMTTTAILAISPSTATGGIVFCSTVGTIVYSNGSNWIRIDNGAQL